MKPEPYEPFSKVWDQLAKWLKLDTPSPPAEGNVRPLRPQGKPGKPGRRWLRVVIGALVVFFIFFLGRGIFLYTEWLWFGEVGYTGVFWKMLLTKVGLGLGGGVVFFAIVYGNILLARKSRPAISSGPAQK